MSDDRVLTADEADAILAKVESSTACISGQEIRALIATIKAAWEENAGLWERVWQLRRERDEMMAEQKGGV